MEIVVVDERDAAAEERLDGAAVDALQVVLADVVGRVRLAREDDLDRPAGRVQDPREPFGTPRSSRSWKSGSTSFSSRS